ncbi:MAG: FAD-dependent oxidoreductase [Bacillota bacterium]
MDIVIVGNGIAGTSAASTLRAFSDTARITIVSDEAYDAYSACVLPRYIAGEIERRKVFLPSEEGNPADGVQRILGKTVSAVDVVKRTIIMDNEALPFDRLILATGSTPLVPRIPGVDKKGVFVLKRLSDADALKGHHGASCVVIGSGLVGVEAAEAMAESGYKVYLIEMLEWILPRALDREPARMVAELMRENGIEVFTSEKVVSICGGECVESVVTSAREIPCDTVILALGMKPNVDLAKAAGVELGTLGGIRVNEFMMTNVHNVYACGDCVESPDLITGRPTLSLLWGSARQQGEVAALSIVDHPRMYQGSMNIMAAEIFGMPIASVGLNLATAGAEAEIAEARGRRFYSRVILVRDVPVGAQFIGEAPGIGVLLSGIRRKAPRELLKRMATEVASLRVAPWYDVIRNYVS